MNSVKAFILASVAVLFVSCKGDEPQGTENVVQFYFNPSQLEMTVGAEMVPGVKYSENFVAKTYDLTANPLGLKFSSSDEKVVTVDGACKVTAVAAGSAVVKAEGQGIRASLNVTVVSKVFEMPDVNAKFDPSMVYGQYALLNGSTGKFTNAQTFDIDDNGNVWLEGAAKPFVYIQCCTQAGKVNPSTKVLEGFKYKSPMSIYYAGHGTCLNVEPGSDPKIWFASFGTKQDDGTYLQPRVLSRTSYVPGKKITPDQAEEHFYFGEEYIKMLPSIDFDTRVVAIWVDSKKTVTMFDLDQVLSAPVKDIAISGIKWGGEAGSPYPKEQDVSITIKAHDCRSLTPIAVVKPAITKGTQGFCVNGPEHTCYHLYGTGEAVDVGLSVFDVKGNFSLKNVGFGFDDDRAALTANGLNNSEYLEAEGIQIRNGKMYVCVTATIAGTRVATILRL